MNIVMLTLTLINKRKIHISRTWPGSTAKMMITAEGQISGLIREKIMNATKLHLVYNIFVFLFSTLIEPLIAPVWFSASRQIFMDFMQAIIRKTVFMWAQLCDYDLK